MCLAIPGKIESVRDEGPFQRCGNVNFGGVIKEVNLSCVPDARVGDYVIVHVGLALSRVDEDEAAKVFQYIRELEERSLPGNA